MIESHLVSRARRLRPATFDSLDEEIFEGHVSYSWCQVQRQAASFQWIRDATAHHMETSSQYAKLASRRGFSLQEMRTHSDLTKVPILSSGTFKGKLLSSHGPDMKICTSSGTMGAKSLVPRDQRTLDRYLGTIVHGVREFFGLSEQRRVVVLGPPAHATGDLWFSYSLGLAELLGPTDYFVTDGRFDPAHLYESLVSLTAVDDGTQIVVVGPPTLLADFLGWLRGAGRSLDLAGGLVITAGGWKARAAQAIDRPQLEADIEELLGVPQSSCRDVFNMVELNTLIMECELHRKHIPPWLAVIVRDARRLTPVAAGDTGILSYLDPTAISYPAFVLSDDIGSVSCDPCGCGRTGETLTIERRLSSVEERGCALKMHSYAGPDHAATSRTITEAR